MKIPALAATIVLPAALLLAGGANANPASPEDAVAPIADSSLELAAAPEPETLPEPENLPEPESLPEAAVELTDAMPVARVSSAPHHLMAGVASESGLQVRTILVERAVSAAFPEIRTMIGVRPDAKPWHPNGLALDIMIPNPGSSAGIALGDAIRDYAMRNAARFGVQDVIWRGTYYTPANGPSGSGYGHYDHVHITTTGGGYPTGNEEYLGDEGQSAAS
ncbi:MAG: hypothetical protein ACR2JI_12335 [Mycobacterium sp.]